MLREVSDGKILCHKIRTDEGSITYALDQKAVADFTSLESTAVSEECTQVHEYLPVNVACQTAGKVVTDLNFMYSGKNSDENCLGEKPFTHNQNECKSNEPPEELQSWALDCCKGQSKCSFSCAVDKCTCTSSPEKELFTTGDTCPGSGNKYVSVRLVCSDPPPPSPSPSKLSDESKIGIGIGSAVGVLVLIGGVYALKHYKKWPFNSSDSFVQRSGFSQMIQL